MLYLIYKVNKIEDKDKMLRTVEMRLNINSLKSKKDVLKWYLQINDGGTPHTKEEIERVKKLYEYYDFTKPEILIKVI